MNNARFLKYVWPFSNIIHERVKQLFRQAASEIQNVVHEDVLKGDLFNYNCWSYLVKRLVIDIGKKLKSNFKVNVTGNKTITV